MEPLTKAIIRGLAFGFFVSIFYFFIPFFIYNFVLGLIRDVSIVYIALYLFGPPETLSLISLAYSYIPGLPVININIPTLILLGLPISVAAFSLGFFKGETVGRGMSGIAMVLLFVLWTLVGIGSLSVILAFYKVSIPQFVLTMTPPYYAINYLNYMVPEVLIIQDIINFIVAIILLFGVVYLVDLGAGIHNNDYWRYWST